MLSVNSIALHVLNHDRQPVAQANERATSDPDLIATANNVKTSSDKAPAVDIHDVFSVHNVDHIKLKMWLFERLGAELGVNMDDYDSLPDYAVAIREIVDDMKFTPEGYQRLKEIERDLGLIKLGLSIDTLINAMIDPEGIDNDKVDEALVKWTGKEPPDGEKKDPRVILESIRLDETGIYGY